MIRLFCCGVFLLFLAGCAGSQGFVKPAEFLAQYSISNPSPDAFVYCSSHDCVDRTVVSLSERQWQAVSGPLKENVSSASTEREALAEAVAYFEQKAAAQAGTSGDVGRTGFYSDRQLDCIDESLNTTTLLTMVSESGLLKFHQLQGTAGRGGALDWPHYAPAIKELESGKTYIVDSWFRDNGEKADIMPLERWKKGWNPQDFN